MLEHAPRFDTSFAEHIGLFRYGLNTHAIALPSERDQNFMLETREGDRLILKIANALEDQSVIEAQQAIMSHLAPVFEFTPRVMLGTDGTHYSLIHSPAGTQHLVWAVTCVHGITLSALHYRSKGLLEDFGRRTGEMARALRNFDHPSAHREFHWDLANGRQVVAERRALITDASLGRAIETICSQFDTYTAPLLPLLRRSIVHGDLNDHNVLVGGGDDLFSRRQHVTGFVDFGDMVYSITIADLAIAIAYVCLGAPDPLSAAAAMVRGYHRVDKLSNNELTALFGLIAMRLCMSACMSADQFAKHPDNAYLSVSQEDIRRTLPVLANIPFDLAYAAFRNACDLEPSPSSADIRDWLEDRQDAFAPVIGIDLRTEPCTVLDLSVGSPLIHGDARNNAEHLLTPRIDAELPRPGHRIAIGRYDEPRLINTSASFSTSSARDAERRTVHMGLDVFADAGTPVHAPLPGTVFAFGDNDQPQDYGPLVILFHAPEEHVRFFTLYGHLGRESLQDLVVGQEIAQGQQFATIGDASVNGGWTPHLHLQLFTHHLGLGTELPGLIPASQREIWRSICPDPNLIVGVPRAFFPPNAPPKEETIARRRGRTTGNLSVAYRDPVRTVRGWKQYLFDDTGRRFLDAYNNVPHVGHSHPRVVEAAARQMRVLNTNTRYLNDQLSEYADRLTATLPSPLSVCMLVNSASEANELALRMARAYTGSKDMITLEAAYHGNTTSLVDISPYKHDGPGGKGAPNWVHVAPLPDDYRGEFRRDDPAAGAKYALQVRQMIEEQIPAALCGFIAETCPSVGGQLMLPPGYLRDVYRYVRSAGGVCIADEVQTGLGRMGTHFWAFDAHGVVPDIVVMGKPLGNGHPMAAVVTTREIADAFDNEMEYFSTFGGNNVSCAIGLAVLDVLRDEHLQHHALSTGNHLVAALRQLLGRFDIIGDVRGSGLFIGVELVRNRQSMEPASEEASYVANRMRDKSILLGTDGPFHNVVKIRPPMPFDNSDADWLVASLTDTLAEL